ncbi:hypothetical protein LSH36_683g02053 [Paralvinella palmiformis]|uniref:Uncharacterized protein n=1 Tax=Paralvinella palmiformis TaxID=53620 RepID=A0AAD9J2H5_9ANNE|nr:hypothetical protein LSH36_683g02053 [Paralvinella palmiformis]
MVILLNAWLGVLGTQPLAVDRLEPGLYLVAVRVIDRFLNNEFIPPLEHLLLGADSRQPVERVVGAVDVIGVVDVIARCVIGASERYLRRG